MKHWPIHLFLIAMVIVTVYPVLFVFTIAFSGEQAEELFATSVTAQDLPRLLAAAGDVLALEDGQRMKAVVE